MSRSLSNQVGILTLGRVFAYAALFFVPLVNVRSLTVEDYGYYRQFWLLFETLSPILILGFPRSLLYYFPRVDREEDKATYVRQSLVFLFFMSLIAWAVYFLMAQLLGVGMGGVAKRFLIRLCLFTTCMMVSRVMDTLFVAERQVVGQAAYQATTSFVQAAAIMSVSWFTRDVESLVWAVVLFALGKFAFTVMYAGARYKPLLRKVSSRSMLGQASYAIPLGLAGTAMVLLMQTDKFLINRFQGREAFAIYSIGAFQIPLVQVLRQSVTNVTFPLMAQYQKEGRSDDIIDLWRRSVVKIAAMFFPIFVFLEVSARPFVTILFTETYADAAPVFALYLLVFLRSTIELGGIVSAFKQNMYLFSVMMGGVVVNLVLSIVLYRVMGRLGVPLSTVITLYLLTFLMVMKSASLLGQPWRRFLPWSGMAVRFLVALLPGGMLYLVYRRVAVDTFVELAVAAAVYFAVYIALAMALRLITVDDLRAIVGRD